MDSQSPTPVQSGVRAHVNEVVALAHLDRLEEARQALQRVYAIKSDFDMGIVRAMAKIMHPSIAKSVIDDLRKAGLPG